MARRLDEHVFWLNYLPVDTSTWKALEEERKKHWSKYEVAVAGSFTKGGLIRLKEALEDYVMSTRRIWAPTKSVIKSEKYSTKSTPRWQFKKRHHGVDKDIEPEFTLDIADPDYKKGYKYLAAIAIEITLQSDFMKAGEMAADKTNQAFSTPDVFLFKNPRYVKFPIIIYNYLSPYIPTLGTCKYLAEIAQRPTYKTLSIIWTTICEDKPETRDATLKNIKTLKKAVNGEKEPVVKLLPKAVSGRR